MKNHFPLLDPLRFGAAVGVAFFHHMFMSWAWVSIGHPGFGNRYVAADVQYPSAVPTSRGSAGWALKSSSSFSRFRHCEFREQVFANGVPSWPRSQALSGGLGLRHRDVHRSGSLQLALPVSRFIVPYIHAMLLVPVPGSPGQSLELASTGHWRPRRRSICSCSARCSRRKSPCGTSPSASASTAQCSTPSRCWFWHVRRHLTCPISPF